MRILAWQRVSARRPTLALWAPAAVIVPLDLIAKLSLSLLAAPGFRWPDESVLFLVQHSNSRHALAQALGDHWNLCQLLEPCARLSARWYGADAVPDLPAMALALLALLYLFVRFPLLISRLSRPAPFGAGLVCGGFIGNFVDLLADGAVTDFIGLGPLTVSPGGRRGIIFNFADLGIIAGAVCCLVGVLRSRPRPAAAPVATSTGVSCYNVVAPACGAHDDDDAATPCAGGGSRPGDLL